MTQNGFLSIHDAAEMIGKSPQTIRRMIKKGTIKAQKIKTPQGFHYVVKAADLTTLSEDEVSEEATVKMLSDSTSQTPIQKDSKPVEEPINEDPTSQNKVLINQHSEKAAPERDLDTLDKNTPSEPEDCLELLHGAHIEKLFLMDLISRLQKELDRERRRPRTLFGHLMDWIKKWD